tara:strand:+ start:1573 stop:1872 length:300 start_codon:yes stop_codon:yes gene_type:complete
MFLWTIKWIIISIILILLIHNIFNYLKDSLTVPKTRDLVTKMDYRYEELNQTVQNAQETEKKEPEDNMKDELQQYLNNMNNNDESVTTIDNIINLNKPD